MGRTLALSVRAPGGCAFDPDADRWRVIFDRKLASYGDEV